jgi:hypothetical protein
VKRSDETTAEADGWFTVSRAAALLGVPVPRIFDQIRDGRLQVRFEPGDPGENDRPLVTSAELKQKSSVPPAPSDAAPELDRAAPAAQTVVAAARTAAAPPAPDRRAELEEARRSIGRLDGELRGARAALDEAEQRLDASLRTIWERDVRIARLEAEIAGQEKSNESAEGFIRHLEARLDKTEARSEEKEREIRRLALGLGEARGEIRLLKPPPPEPAPRWRRTLGRAALLLAVASGSALAGWVAFALSARALPREAGLAAGVGATAAFLAGYVLERLRRAR